MSTIDSNSFPQKIARSRLWKRTIFLFEKCTSIKTTIFFEDCAKLENKLFTLLNFFKNFFVGMLFFFKFYFSHYKKWKNKLFFTKFLWYFFFILEILFLALWNKMSPFLIVVFTLDPWHDLHIWQENSVFFFIGVIVCTCRLRFWNKVCDGILMVYLRILLYFNVNIRAYRLKMVDMVVDANSDVRSIVWCSGVRKLRRELLPSPLQPPPKKNRNFNCCYISRILSWRSGQVLRIDLGGSFLGKFKKIRKIGLCFCKMVKNTASL